MADVTISGLSEGSPNKSSAIIPYSDGITTYRTAPSGIVAAAPGSVLQVQSTSSSTQFTIPANQDGALMSVSITPKSSSNKILIDTLISWNSDNPNGGFAIQRSVDGGTTYQNIGPGTITGVTPTRTVNGIFYFRDVTPGNDYDIAQTTYQYLDSPNTTNSIIYRIYWYKIYQTVGVFYFNRPIIQNYSPYWSNVGAVSFITAMEIAG